MLTELSAKNFKSWREIPSTRLAPITGLFGANSSGKSSILQLLLMLKQTVESADRTETLVFGDDRNLANLGAFRDVVFRHALPGSIEFKVAWNLQNELEVEAATPQDEHPVILRGGAITFSACVRAEEDNRPVVDRMSYDFADHQFIMRRKKPLSSAEAGYELQTEGDRFDLLRRAGRPTLLPPPIKCYGFPDRVNVAYQNVGFLADLQFEFEQLFGRLFYLGPLRDYPHREYKWAQAEPADMGRRGERVIEALLAAKARGEKVSPRPHRPKVPIEQYVAQQLRAVGLIDSFSVKPEAADSNVYRVWVRKSPSSPEVLITDVGFGVSQILPALVLCYYVPKGSTIILEQPEIHLHPTVQAGLADIFIDAVQRRNVQIIFESHSEYLLQRLQRRIAEDALKTHDAALYFCDQANGESRLIELDVDLFGHIRNWPEGFFGDEFSEVVDKQLAAMKRQESKQP